MAKKQYPPIRTESYVRVNGVLTNTDDLTPAQKRELATKLSIQILSARFPGYVFSPAEEGCGA